MQCSFIVRRSDTEAGPFRRNPKGRWGLPSIPVSLVGHDARASFPPHSGVSTARPVGANGNIPVTAHQVRGLELA